ncbi:efflux RND transporter permease subunit [Neptunomonas japonica]|uniref:RND family efflux transporter n=1 Tax=Neptunomonas japonica JAMM 1380 TaxID=1441457 RepID=A0A7R6PLN8_9GAMM|nr:MMPL family transporter [Neptunomonas japonica]BBB30491.1 RND family efflux transporter [Neptunomonas japonica JAMM 1380]
MKHECTSAEHHILHPLEDSEPVLERAVFRFRPALIFLFIMATLFLGYKAIDLRPDASFEKMIPTFHPYIANYLEHKEDLSGLGNAVRISIESTNGDIFNADFLETLKKINDEVFFISGVDRSGLKSIWTPNVRWSEVTEEGLAGGAVIPDGYDGSEASLSKLRVNITKSGQVGTLISNNYKSALVYAPLYDTDPQTGERLDYQAFSRNLEQLIRDKYETDHVKIHITGFAKVVGDLIDGASQVIIFFILAIGITLVLIYLYSRCIKSTLVPLACSIIAVIWQLGLLRTFGYGLDPYSMLVPFLVFAIAVSHGVQVINAIGINASEGNSPEVAARKAFRVLYIPGLTALISDGIGFITLMVIKIEVIQDLAVAASLGVAAIILTNLVLLPILMSYLGVSQKGIKHLNKPATGFSVWSIFVKFTQPKIALITITLAVTTLGLSVYESRNLKVGDLDAGAPELRQDSRYNLDNKFMVDNYSSSTDIFVTLVKTSDNECITFETLDTVDRFQWRMQQIEGVQTTRSVVNAAKRGIVGLNEGNLKWATLSRNQFVLNAATSGKHVPPGMINGACNLIPVVVYLNDHRAETLNRVVAEVESFAAENNHEGLKFLMAAGNAGIEAATNIVIDKSQYEMLMWVYGVVSLLCLLTFRSLRTVICIITPLALTSALCQALMTHLGIGVKVATLPVIALGVGIGVDYGIYIYTKLETYLKSGQSLEEAYLNTLKTTGKAVAFTGLTLAIGVGTWAWSPIKFQADMGILLTFMFILNMLGALILLPALARWLIRVEPKAPSISTAISTI